MALTLRHAAQRAPSEGASVETRKMCSHNRGTVGIKMIDIIRELKVDEVDNADSVCELKVGELKNVAGGSIIWGDVFGPPPGSDHKGGHK